MRRGLAALPLAALTTEISNSFFFCGHTLTSQHHIDDYWNHTALICTSTTAKLLQCV